MCVQELCKRIQENKMVLILLQAVMTHVTSMGVADVPKLAGKGNQLAATYSRCVVSAQLCPLWCV